MKLKFGGLLSMIKPIGEGRVKRISDHQGA